VRRGDVRTPIIPSRSLPSQERRHRRMAIPAGHGSRANAGPSGVAFYPFDLRPMPLTARSEARNTRYARASGPRCYSRILFPGFHRGLLTWIPCPAIAAGSLTHDPESEAVMQPRPITRVK
jgi:hypothetical protein